MADEIQKLAMKGEKWLLLGNILIWIDWIERVGFIITIYLYILHLFDNELATHALKFVHWFT